MQALGRELRGKHYKHSGMFKVQHVSLIASHNLADIGSRLKVDDPTASNSLRTPNLGNGLLGLDKEAVPSAGRYSRSSFARPHGCG